MLFFNSILTTLIAYNFEGPHFNIRLKRNSVVERAKAIHQYFTEKQVFLNEKNRKILKMESTMGDEDREFLVESLRAFKKHYLLFNEYYGESKFLFDKVIASDQPEEYFDTYKSYLHSKFNTEEMMEIKRKGEAAYCKIVTYF